MDLKTHIAGLSDREQVGLGVKFARLALPIWEEYASQHSLEYIDSVVGMFHQVEADLLARSLDAIEKHLEEGEMPDVRAGELETIRGCRKEFLDPVVSLQDDDWELPYAVERAFYSVYNLLRKVLGEMDSLFGEPLTYVIVNQAVDALLKSKRMNREEIRQILFHRSDEE